jgi:hypothetical protein
MVPYIHITVKSAQKTGRGNEMKKKKLVYRELTWFFCAIVGGILIFLFLYDLLNVDIDLGVLAAGVIVTLVAMYAVRLTLWVFKKNM